MGGWSAFGSAAWTATAVRIAATRAAAAKPNRRVAKDVRVRGVRCDIVRVSSGKEVGCAEPQLLYVVAPLSPESNKGQRPGFLYFFTRRGPDAAMLPATLRVKLPSGNRFDGPSPGSRA